MKRYNICHVSDINGTFKQIELDENIDILIITGDALSDNTSVTELEEFLNWLDNIPTLYKIYVPGHNSPLFEEYVISKMDMITNPDFNKNLESYWSETCRLIDNFFDNKYDFLLVDDSIEIDGINIGVYAYMNPHYENSKNTIIDTFKVSQSEINFDLFSKHLNKDYDIFVTNIPPYGILDEAYEHGLPIGSIDLLLFCKLKPSLRLHTFGYTMNRKSYGYGYDHNGSDTTFSNCPAGDHFGQHLEIAGGFNYFTIDSTTKELTITS